MKVDDKAALRRRMAAMKRRYSREELDASSARAVAKLLREPHVASAQTILLYYSLPDEVNTHGLVEQLYHDGRRALLPRVVGQGQMELIPYAGVASLRDIGHYHIMEPVGEAFSAFDQVDVAIVPGVAFTAEGERLGRGGGYYDHILPRLSHAFKLGLCFDFQVVDDLPTDSHDQLMDAVICG